MCTGQCFNYVSQHYHNSHFCHYLSKQLGHFFDVHTHEHYKLACIQYILCANYVRNWQPKHRYRNVGGSVHQGQGGSCQVEQQ